MFYNLIRIGRLISELLEWNVLSLLAAPPCVKDKLADIVERTIQTEPAEAAQLSVCSQELGWHSHAVLLSQSYTDAARRLYHAALAGDLVAMAAALAQGAEVNGSIGEEEGRTALIGAAVGVREHTERRGDSGNPVITKRNNQLRAARKKNLVFYVCK